MHTYAAVLPAPAYIERRNPGDNISRAPCGSLMPGSVVMYHLCFHHQEYPFAAVGGREGV